MKVRLKLVLGFVVLWVVTAVGWLGWKANKGGYFDGMVIIQRSSVTDGGKYEVLVEELERWRGDLSARYGVASSSKERLAVEHDARVMLELMMPEMMRCWVGTGYDFNGTAEKPGEGKVACGYYVSTVLRDAGFRVDRYKLAQQASENILLTFLPKKSCLLKAGKDYEEYMDWMEGQDYGVYMIGLDTHVGFLVNGVDGLRFFHSSSSRGVVEELRKDAGAIRRSRWRMIGNLSADPGAIRVWLGGEKVEVRR